MKRPLAFKLWTFVFALVVAIQLWGGIELIVGPDGRTGPAVALQAFKIALVVWYAIATWHMSRWPSIVILSLTTYTLVSGFWAEPSWNIRYPLLGPFAVAIPMLLYAATILPHWRNMTWRLLGFPRA